MVNFATTQHPSEPLPVGIIRLLLIILFVLPFSQVIPNTWNSTNFISNSHIVTIYQQGLTIKEGGWNGIPPGRQGMGFSHRLQKWMGFCPRTKQELPTIEFDMRFGVNRTPLK